MLALAIFALGVIVGVRFGVFSLLFVGAVVCAVTLIGNRGGGFVGAGARALEMWGLLIAGFLVALVGSWLLPRSKPGVAPRLGRWSRARDRRLTHGPQ